MKNVDAGTDKQAVAEAVHELWKCYVDHGRPMTEDTLECLRVLNTAKEEAEWLDDEAFSQQYQNAIQMARTIKGEHTCKTK